MEIIREKEMIEELKITILSRIINELFQEADRIIKEGIKVSVRTEKIISIGLGVSVIGFIHAVVPSPAALYFDAMLIVMGAGNIASSKMQLENLEVQKTKGFFEYFNIETPDICNVLNRELSCENREETYFSEKQISKIKTSGILDFKNEEIEVFSKIAFNDEQEDYLKQLISQNKKINIINFLQLAMMEGTSQNQRFVDFGGKNKTLQEILNPERKLKYA